MASNLCFSLLILLSSLSFASSQYVLPERYFINCGSSSDIDFTNRKFVSDVNPSNFSISGGHVAAENNNPATDTPAIYRTARVFTKKSWYELEADENNTFVMVRLHFSQFSSNGFEFSNSKLDVSVSTGFSLLSGFSTGNTTVIREFIFPIRLDRKFRIEFTPSRGSTSAFVNAIEAFTTPSNLFRPASSFSRISPSGRIGDLENLTSDYAFNKIHRVNVGGPTINIDRDTLRRTWTPDDSFIFNKGPARNVSYDNRINYLDGGATSFDAPDDVYKTAQQLNNSLVNITWIFNVNKNAKYLVRVHFCDIISKALTTDGFNFFVYSHHKEEIQPSDIVRVLQAPFYLDLVVESTDSDRLNISIGAISGNNQPVFLNGVEIMELLKNSGVRHPVNNGKKGKSVVIVVGCVLAGVAFLLVLLAGFFIGSRCGKQKQVVVGAKSESHVVPSYGRSTSYTSINVDFTVNHPSPVLDLNLRVPFADIVQATNNFDENLMLGRGGFGKVYKGTLHGTKVAVKRGEQGHGQGRPEFVTEILVLSRIRHKHLVSLIGYCDENNEMLLVYEFMEKGTLQDHLYDSDLPRLSWKQRLEICISATRGLHYLHTGSEGGIIHRDVKSTNILLNEHYVAKVADFGISRLENVDEGEMSIVKGSFGYLDPEYVRCMKLTQKSDVYSFGVVLLEVLCARPALDHRLPPKEVNLADWAIKQIKNGNLDKIIDSFLAGTINQDSLRKFVEIAERCLKETGDERPSMVDVLWDLEYVLKLQLMSADRESYDDSTINTSFQLPMSIIDRLPSRLNDDYEVNDSSVSSYPSDSQVFSQLKIDEAR